MKFFKWMKDGGPESHSEGFFFVEIKSLFTIVLLKFSDGSRDAYHSHAFNAFSWLLKGCLVESFMKDCSKVYWPSSRLIFTGRNTFHKVTSDGESWALSFRGPWKDSWMEYIPKLGKFFNLTHGRKAEEVK